MDTEQFIRMFGGPLDIKTLDELGGYDWRYEVVDEATSNKIVLDLLHAVENRSFSIVGENSERWQRGWSENLEEFQRTGDVRALEPKYLRPARYLRLDRRFIKPVDPTFEANWYKVFRGWFARRYLTGFDAIYEFGSGSGHNVAFLAQEFPEKMVMGFDWAGASVEILDALGDVFPGVHGARFDFFEPPLAYRWLPNTAVLTVGALEQTGARWRPFLDFLRRTQPAMCFHVEPVLEWYDPGNLVDHTAIKIHETRGFWRGFVNEVTPLWRHRTGFGSLMLEGYSQMAWCP
jgi:hypothetical protein